MINGATTAKAASILALAGAVSTALGGTSNADPQLSPAQIKSQVDKLFHEAEEVTEQYNGVKEKADSTESSVERLREQAARRTAGLNAARDALGSFAAAQYRSGGIDPMMQLALSSDPDKYLEQAAILERAGNRHASAVEGLGQRLRSIEQLRGEAGSKLESLEQSRTKLAEHKRTIEGKLSKARRLLNTLDPTQRAAVLAEGEPSAADRSMPRGSIEAPSARAAAAVAFAYSALGKPYVWGATGPNAFDCSGLTQAAWRSAGLSLPRTTFTQINAGTRVPRSALAPGDLVFFYSGLSHVGLYVGNGQMIHAPRPGAPVRVAPINQMPFAAAVRPG